MGRNKSRYIDKADKKKLKDKSTVVSTIGHDPGTRNIRKADYSSISAKDRPNRHNNPRTGIDTRVQSKTSNNSNWLHAVGFVVLAAIVISWALGYCAVGRQARHRRGVAGPVGDVLRRRVGSVRCQLLPDTRVSTKLDNY